MAIAKVALIKTAPERTVQGQWYRRPGLGLCVLASFLERHGYDCEIIDMSFFGLTLGDAVERARRSGAKLFGITAMTHEIDRAHELASHIKGRVPGSVAAVGGPHVTALPFETLGEFPSFDFGIAGEGEYALKGLMDCLDGKAALGGIKGLIYREDGRVVVNGQGDRIPDLDALPFPNWDHYPPVEEYPIFSSRGCPFSCKFCMRVLGRKVRYRSPENVVDEMEYVVDRYGPRRISFQDETFTVNPERAHAVMDLIMRRGLHRRVKWDICARVTDLDEALCRRLKEAGCYKVGVGVESGNDEILRRVGKGITTAAAARGVEAAKRAGLKTEAYYILGHPDETEENIRETIRFAARLNTTTAAFGIMVPYPGTAIYDMAKRGEGGYKVISRSWSDYNKHLGNAVELEGISRRRLEMLQMSAYLNFYIRNLRIGDLLGYVMEKRAAVCHMLRKLILNRDYHGAKA